MKVLIDMNLSPDWVRVLREGGHEVVHWSEIGAPRATDKEIFEWAGRNGYIVFTHDLDFGAILAATGAHGPSVIQFRVQDVSPTKLKDTAMKILRRFEGDLKRGSLIVVDETKSRIRVLPLMRRP